MKLETKRVHKEDFPIWPKRWLILGQGIGVWESYNSGHGKTIESFMEGTSK